MQHTLRLLRAAFGLALLVVLLPFASRAQTSGGVTGTLLDQTSGQPLPFANVVLLQRQDSSFVAGAQTAENGAFRLEKVPAGGYLLRASVLGYKPLRQRVVVQGSVVALGALRLASTATALRGVTVQGEKAAVVDNLDKKVINVSKDLTSVGGTAVNVLQNVPSVNVDQNGGVTLRGTSNVTIYIDGKPSGAAGGGRNVNLDQIPASSIESVEVITNPSARYDAEGSGGIINIVLKKQKQDGFNGQAGANAGTGDKYNTSLSLNRRQGKFNYFGSYDFRQDRFWSRNTTLQTSVAGGVRNVTDQISRQRQQPSSHAVRVGFDYSLTPEQTISVTVQPRLNHRLAPEDLVTNLTSYARSAKTGRDTTLYATLLGRNVVESNVRSADFTLDYRRTWAGQKRRELTASAVYSPVGGDQTLLQRQNEDAPNRLVQQQLITFQLPQASAQLDYVHPVGEKGRVDTGLKTTYRGTDGTYDFLVQPADRAEYQRDEARSNHYRYRDYVQAGYATYQNEKGKFSYQAGLRIEQTSTRGILLNTSQEFSRDYFNFFPSVTLAQNLPADQRLQLSYSRRINRPDISVLLPFANYSDPRNYRVGNVRLRPENINVLELGHQKSWGPATLSTTAFFRQTLNQVQRIREVDAEASDLNSNLVVTRTTFVNARHNTTYGLELSLNQPLTKWWRLTATGSGYRNIVSAVTGTEADNRNVAYTARLNTTITPVKKLDVQLTGNYRSANVTVQGRIAPVYFVDAALKKDVLQDRGSITLRVSDVFNTQQFVVDAYNQGLESTFRFKRESRIAFLGFTYRFGNDQPAPPRPRRRDQPSGTTTGGDLGG
ncbi:outer membrane beta-barrel protein [Hymenobacter persicinus]|uniref:TonB-dependent receptor n=1 Tax=Hymenobacter persicinus TaxID=2025506 RepID=A0A4Q5L982_9BACT|nr:outer membrane beta-barrel protein [Hymenobacter persicinus]RYU78054.1 TonB-dependent receptor [Hymenobacter persicinus]